MNSPEFKLSIDVTIVNGSGGPLSNLVNSALQEVTNRTDFRCGTFKLGRVYDQTFDHDDVRVTVDISALHIKPKSEG